MDESKSNHSGRFIIDRHFSEEHSTNVALINAVRKHPCLYNSNISSYAKKEDVDDAWDAVGVALKKPGKFEEVPIFFPRIIYEKLKIHC